MAERFKLALETVPRHFRANLRLYLPNEYGNFIDHPRPDIAAPTLSILGGFPILATCERRKRLEKWNVAIALLSVATFSFFLPSFLAFVSIVH